ncbi:MAG: hypothetical protein ACREO3_02110 [Arenimonas sp.]
MNRHGAIACASLVFLAALLPATPAGASHDYKSVHGSQCLPRGPGTTAAELTIGAYGIANPGWTDETVICSLPVDNEQAWTGSNELFVRYRAGTVPGRITCTVSSGAFGAQDEAVTSYSSTSSLQAAGSAAGTGAGRAGTSVDGSGPADGVGGVRDVAQGQDRRPVDARIRYDQYPDSELMAPPRGSGSIDEARPTRNATVGPSCIRAAQ